MDKIKYHYLSAAEVLDTVLDVYKKTFKPQIALSVIFNMIFMIVAFIVSFAGIFIGAVALMGSIASDTIGPMTIFLISVFVLFFFFLAMLQQALYASGNIIMSKRAFLDENFSLSDVIRQSFKKVLPLASVAVAQSILAIPFVIVCGVLLGLYLWFISVLPESLDTAYIAFIVFTSVMVIVLLFFAGLLLGTFICLSYPVAVFENKNFFAAVTRGYQLIKPDFWKTFGIIAIYGVVSMMISYSFTAFSGVTKGLTVMFLPPEAAAYISVLSIYGDYMFSIVISIILNPLYGIFSAILYINQRIKTEGLDIELELNRLKTASSRR